MLFFICGASLGCGLRSVFVLRVAGYGHGGEWFGQALMNDVWYVSSGMAGCALSSCGWHGLMRRAFWQAVMPGGSCLGSWPLLPWLLSPCPLLRSSGRMRGRPDICALG